VIDPADAREDGFTLIEIMISLALFALISMAGIALVDAVIRVEERTAGRLERLGQFQRALFLISRDLEQMALGSLEQVEGGVQFQRQGSTIYEPPRPIGYAFRDGSLFRRAGADQLLVDRIADVRWSFFFPGRGWQSALPPDDPQRPIEPAGIAVEIRLDDSAGPSGSLRRVVELPVGPPPPLSAPSPVVPIQ
jgi:general secretion pathway protein J